jgi:microcystin-dependent protein
MSDQFVAEIRILGFNFAPNGWAFCNGQLMPISQNTALFSLLGTQYGGDGRVTFALPNLQASFPMHTGSSQGSGLSPHSVGESGGAVAVTLTSNELPSHTHAVNAGASAPVQQANGSLPGASAARAYAPPPANATSFLAVQPAGSGLPHNNMPPFLALNFCIALQGIFPPRS